MQIQIFVPRDGHLRGIERIRPGSGIVGTYDPQFADYVIDFEGNINGAMNIVTFGDRLLHAAGRHEARYPTVARARAFGSQLVVVGMFDTAFGETTVTLADPLAQWLGVDQLDPNELNTSNGTSRDLRVVRGWTAEQRLQLKMLPPSQRAAYQEAGLI